MYGADYHETPDCPEEHFHIHGGINGGCDPTPPPPPPPPSTSPPLTIPPRSCMDGDGNFIYANAACSLQQTVTVKGKPCYHGRGGCSNAPGPAGSGIYWCYFLDQVKATENRWGKLDRRNPKNWNGFGFDTRGNRGLRWEYCSLNADWDYEGNVSSQYL